MSPKSQGMKRVSNRVALTGHPSSPKHVIQRLLAKYGKTCFIVLSVIAVVLESFTLVMVNNNAHEAGSAVGTVQRVITSAKRVLATLLHEPRAVPVTYENGEHPPEPMVKSAVFGGFAGASREEGLFGGTDREEGVIDGGVVTYTDHDPLLHPNHTVCVRARSFKLVGSHVTVTTCLYRGKPMIDIRRWEDGVMVPRLKPVVLSLAEYFGLSRQHAHIESLLRSVEIHVRFPVRDDYLVVEQDHGTPQDNATIT